jgi:uncharacterized membrane protein YedE/YeeE
MADLPIADLLATRPPFYVIGALIGFTVVGLLATTNQRVGALGGYSALYERASGRARRLSWTAWFLGGIFIGALLFGLLADTAPGDGYGWLTRTFADDWLVGALLLGGGVLIGFGAKNAGGCTSGNGVCGTSLGSPASFVATATFIAVAIGVTFLIDAAIA